jgi:hypothetical protein
MNNRFVFMYGFRLIELLAAVGIVFLSVYFCRIKPDGLIARCLRHRDRIWFALMLLLVPAIVTHLLISYFWKHPVREPNVTAETVSLILNGFCGAIYGTVGCLFASPAKREERFSFWTALTVTVVLIILAWGISMTAGSFRITHDNHLSIVLSEAVLILVYLASRAARGKNSALLQGDTVKNNDGKSEHNPTAAFLWLLVGLAPIPLLLVLASANAPHPTLAASALIICPICNLCGGIGCLGGIKNAAVRIILGLFLAAFFFGLSVIVALFQACSHSGGI